MQRSECNCDTQLFVKLLIAAMLKAAYNFGDKAMDTNALLDAAKEATRCKSDYALAKALQINSGLIARLRKGERQPDAYTCGRIAEVLGKDALELIAEVEAANEKNPIRREWWLRFLSSLPRSGVMIVCGLLSLAGFSPTGPVRAVAADVLNVYYVK